LQQTDYFSKLQEFQIGEKAKFHKEQRETVAGIIIRARAVTKVVDV